MVRPPAGLPGLDPSWSLELEAPDADGVPRRWHVLERRPQGEPVGTMLCVHGNPTWSYLWRRVLAAAPDDWRVIAVDQLGMGYSERLGPDPTRTLAQRIEDLDRLAAALDVRGPVVAVGHDWGGMVVSGWAQRHARPLAADAVADAPADPPADDASGAGEGETADPIRVAGIVLANTAVHHDFAAGLPPALRLARHPLAWRAACVDTPAFVRGATAVSSPRPDAAVARAYAAPYGSAADRGSVGAFVADIPLEEGHPTRATLAGVAAGMSALAEFPALLLRGPKDPVFSEAHLRDLRRRLPRADVHRYETASHLVLEDAPRSAADIWAWVAQRVTPTLAPREAAAASGPPAVAAPTDGFLAGRPPVPEVAVGTAEVPWQGLLDAVAATPDELCVTEMRTGRRMSFAELETDVAAVAAGFARLGMRDGDRVALLVPPGIDLTVAVYAAWRVGAVIVVADAGLGLASTGRALRGAGPAFVVGIAQGIAACAAMRVPGARIVAGPVAPALRRTLGVTATLDELRRSETPARRIDRDDEERVAHDDGPGPLREREPDAECAVLFTSGATGPSKGVLYRTDGLRTMIGHVGGIYELEPGDRLVAAFAPFALYGPALGIGAVVPDMDVTRPGSLSAAALADAVLAAEATVVFASPAALRNVVRTASDLTDEQRTALGRVRAVMSAGAPVPVSLLRAVREVMPAAVPHTPYGMTETLPVSDITLEEIEASRDDGGPAGGVCVGVPLPGVDVRIAPLPADPDDPDGALTDEPGVTGEIVVRAAHVKDRYDQLWATQHETSPAPSVHRTGDVGHLDGRGRLWVEGRRVHVLHTAAGPVTPVGLEQAAGTLPGVASATVVGVGPRGAQQVVVVLVLEPDHARVARRLPGLARHAPRLAPPSLAARVREAAPAGLDVAAVLLAPRVPVDIRHESKVDRTAVAAWATRVLAGQRVGAP
ncbi:alpha/beta fold hydrolase [Agilicoccus flavus]|uniref:alpha/beta fold hydrolase n=1 Tax=Agilicoccus flavus TaxID=2775968 RepID=UPI001CF61E76|nr:alpha/beta fold hydrolase [Agilicoccus flavus]